jgi:GDP-mannose transporter
MRQRNVRFTRKKKVEGRTKKAEALTLLAGFPISVLLIGMIYTSTKALKYLSIPVYTIFKNLTIILIAYGEVLWFGGSVTPMALFSFGLMVMSSVIAAWADIKHALESHGHMSSEATARIATLNAGYIWMLTNCLCTAAYVLGMRKRIKLTNFKDFDSKCWKCLHRRIILTPE